MNNRDREYIENRLMAPAAGLGEAMERLRDLGRHDEYDKLMAANRDLHDACRSVRRYLFYPERGA